MGYSWMLNWEWGDDDSMIFPWGIVHPCDRIAKAPLHTYRNLSWFFRSFRPKYVQPDQKRRRPERLKELAGVEPVEPLTDPKVPTSLRKVGRETTINPNEPYGGWKEAYTGRVALRLRPAGAHVLATDVEGGPVVVSRKLGKGRVVFNADFSTNAPAVLIEAFLREADINREHTDPDDPGRIRVFRLPVQERAAGFIPTLHWRGDEPRGSPTAGKAAQTKQYREAKPAIFPL